MCTSNWDNQCDCFHFRGPNDVQFVKEPGILTLNNRHIIHHCPKTKHILCGKLNVMVAMEILNFRNNFPPWHARRIFSLSPGNICKTCIILGWCHKSFSQPALCDNSLFEKWLRFLKHEEIIGPDIFGR